MGRAQSIRRSEHIYLCFQAYLMSPSVVAEAIQNDPINWSEAMLG